MKQTKIPKNKTGQKKLGRCPYCQGKLVKRGWRQKKHEKVQIYYCKHCDKRMTSNITKNTKYPLRVIIDSLTYYNKINKISETKEMIKDKYGLDIQDQTIKKWTKKYSKYTQIKRMREFIQKKYAKNEIIEQTKMIHSQIYHYMYHKAKTDIILSEEYRHYRFKRLQEFLDLVIAECPHQLFLNNPKRASQYKKMFNLENVKITPKQNTATKITKFVIQAVKNNKQRHQTLQEFMLANDSCTIAVEVPIIMDESDIIHYKHQLGFDVPIKLLDGQYITGHVDIVQVRNGAIYIMDYKPGARREKPIEQLTIYALALSRLTGIRLYHFKCAWFDDSAYYEFFPLHVVYKINKKKRKIMTGQKRLTEIG